MSYSVQTADPDPPNRVNAHLLRFGVFDLNIQTRELRKAGVRIRLQDQPFRVLSVLLERPGELISRDELKKRLWGETEFGDFDQAINVAVKKLRLALGDVAENPRFIETLPRRGYRFIAPVIAGQNGLPASIPSTTTSDVSAAHRSRKLAPYGLFFLAAVLVLIAAKVLLVRNPKPHALGVASGEFRLVPLTGELGSEMDPQFSPDGKAIAYVWASGKGDMPDVYVKSLNDGSPARLLPAQDGIGHMLPAWSPDGQYIAFVRFERSPDLKPNATESAVEQIKKRNAAPWPRSVYVAPVIGGNERKLFDVVGIDDLRWSPDGKWLLTSEHSSRDEPFSLYRVSLDGGERRRLTFPPENFVGDVLPAFSPDGRLLAFARNISSGGFDIFVMSANGGEPRRLTHDGEHIDGLTFSQNSRDVILSSARGGGERHGLWRVAVTGGTPVRLPFGSDDAQSPTIPVKGNYLAYVKSTQSDKIWAYDIPAPGEAATPGRVAIASRQLQVMPQFSPDGRRIAFASTRSGSWEIWVSAPDGSNAIQLTNFGGRQTGSPRWSADGKQLAFDARPQTHSEIYVIDAEGGKAHRITTSNGNDAVVPSWSHDGRWIYYASNASGHWDIWKTPADGSHAPLQATSHGGFAAFESTDGKTLYYAKSTEDGIFSMPVDGGPETLVTGELLRSVWRFWAVGDQGIYLLRPERKRNSTGIIPTLSLFHFGSRQISDLRAFDETVKLNGGMTVAPDGKHLLLSQPDEGGSEIMIVENFR